MKTICEFRKLNSDHVLSLKTLASVPQHGDSVLLDSERGPERTVMRASYDLDRSTDGVTYVLVYLT